MNLSDKILGLVVESEGIEGFKLDETTVSMSNDELMKNINKDTVLGFLRAPGTRLICKRTDNGEYVLYAHNKIAKETIEINGLGNHFVALAQIVEMADKVRKARKNGEKVSVLTNDLIKQINLQIQLRREGEVGIGEYRQVINGIAFGVAISKIIDGKICKSPCIDLETCRNRNVFHKMDELLDWVNNHAFKDETKDVFEDMAEFHARFIKIHPFREGNGRTCRLLCNYLMLVNGKPMFNIPEQRKGDYNFYLDYANATTEELFVSTFGTPFSEENWPDLYAKILKENGPRTDENRYKPLAKFLKGCIIKENAGEIVAQILNYNGVGDNGLTFKADQIK